MSIIRTVVVTLVLAGLAGCGLHTTRMAMNPPVADQPGGGRNVVIAEVTDGRAFATLPESSRERLDASAQAELGVPGRSAAIGGNGNFIVMLKQGDSVQDWVRDLVTTGLRKNGYIVVPKTSAPAGTPTISVKVEEFWTYVPVNFGRALTWTNQMKAWIQTRIEIQGQAEPAVVTVSGTGAHIIQMFSEQNVRESYGLAADDYLIQFQRKVLAALL
ncbi:hypothetical protein FHW69_003494 [Luteibacter sp. Sphag1AF]|uniref:hypothetical protein n=1 Tax=Luteibacter sp. Sphag1AF TaxID=2587031 RepID=UPI00161C2759|nr:hypothetical protein [Luteibacter sp. Sphag1AF]MBB3228849.1 hypothetical protein [Luteibacter sp. Sphag1AF]